LPEYKIFEFFSVSFIEKKRREKMAQQQQGSAIIVKVVVADVRIYVSLFCLSILFFLLLFGLVFFFVWLDEKLFHGRSFLYV